MMFYFHVFRGEPKCWYSVPGSEANAFEKVRLLSDISKKLFYHFFKEFMSNVYEYASFTSNEDCDT